MSLLGFSIVCFSMGSASSQSLSASEDVLFDVLGRPFVGGLFSHSRRRRSDRLARDNKGDLI